ncbi:hypothetical protein NEOLI_002643, partial [Neolecta irregularis DAH-3]
NCRTDPAWRGRKRWSARARDAGRRHIAQLPRPHHHCSVLHALLPSLCCTAVLHCCIAMSRSQTPPDNCPTPTSSLIGRESRRLSASAHDFAAEVADSFSAAAEKVGHSLVCVFEELKGVAASPPRPYSQIGSAIMPSSTRATAEKHFPSNGPTPRCSICTTNPVSALAGAKLTSSQYMDPSHRRGPLPSRWLQLRDKYICVSPHNDDRHLYPPLFLRQCSHLSYLEQHLSHHMLRLTVCRQPR